MMKSIFSEVTATKIKAIILSIVIAIVLSSFVIYLTETFHPRPEWEDFCGEVSGPRTIKIPAQPEEVINATDCEEDGGTWRNGYCDYYYECQQKYDDVNDEHRLVVFVVSVIAGLLAVAIGIALALPSVSSGLMLGGGFLTLYGTFNYWSDLSNWLRALVLGVVLIILIWLGYKKLGS